MVQARRTGQKRKLNNKSRKKTRSSQQWGLLLIVLLSGLAIGALIFGYGPFGKGLKNYREQVIEAKPIVNNVASQEDEKEKSVIRTDKEFTFYNVLEDDIGRVLPDDFPVAETEREKKKSSYIMQLASFQSFEGAQALRAKLALKGIETRVEEKNGNFRVKMGPYNSRRTLKNDRNKVKGAGLGLRPIAIQLM